jgi:hypothetical protein
VEASLKGATNILGIREQEWIWGAGCEEQWDSILRARGYLPGVYGRRIIVGGSKRST